MLTSKLKRTALLTGLEMALLGAAAVVQVPGQPELSSVIIQGYDFASVTATCGPTVICGATPICGPTV